MASIGIASTNRVKHTIVRETTFGVTPTSPALRALRTTGSTLSADPATVASDELRSDRMVADLILVGMQSKGDINAELSFAEIDPDLEEALQSSWVAQPAIANTAAGTPISSLTTTNINFTAGGSVIPTGSLMLTSGFANSANNRVSIAGTVTDTSITTPGGFTADASPQAGASVRVVGLKAASGDIVATANGLTSTVTSFTFYNIVPGQWVKIGSGTTSANSFANAANNDFVRVNSVSNHGMTFDVLPTGWAADAGTGKTIVIWTGDYLRNSTTQYSNTIERQYLDQATPTYEYFKGMCLDRLVLTLSAQQVAKLTKTYTGATAVAGTTRISGVTDIAPASYPVLNASANVGRLGVGGALDTGPDFITEISLSLANNLRQLNGVSYISAVGVGDGEMTITGTLNSYFGDLAYYNNLLTNTAISVDFRVGATNPLNGTYLFDMPYVKLTSGAPTVPAKNQNVMLNLGFQALRHPGYGYEMHVGRYFYYE